jgi:hypothetical protein
MQRGSKEAETRGTDTRNLTILAEQLAAGEARLKFPKTPAEHRRSEQSAAHSRSVHRRQHVQDESEIWTFANEIVSSFGMMQAKATVWPRGWIVPAGLKFSIGKNRQNDFDLMVRALDAAGVDKAARLKKQAGHKNVSDDDLILTVGPRH